MNNTLIPRSPTIAAATRTRLLAPVRNSSVSPLPAAGFPLQRGLGADNIPFRRTLGVFQARMGEMPLARKGRTETE